MKSTIIYGDNTESYTAEARKAAASYRRATGKTAYAVEVKDANGYVSFRVFNTGGQEVGLYGLENARIVKGYAQ